MVADAAFVFAHSFLVSSDFLLGSVSLVFLSGFVRSWRSCVVLADSLELRGAQRNR